jgi:ribosomal subunit interface protein
VTRRFFKNYQKDEPPGRDPDAGVGMRKGEVMRYQISGKQIDVGEALQTHVKAEMGEVVEKYAQRPTECVVVFSRVAHEFVCEAVIHLSTGLTAQAKGHAPEIYAAFESCREKMDKQLRRYKRRIRNHHSTRPEPVEFGGASSYILAANEDTEDAEPDSLTPVVIAEMETKIPSITVGEAVMQMELAGQRMLVFRNEGHGGVNVVYRRDDGNIGWIDPRNSK